jgi:carbon-monoxide dehydrogenase small subunit
VKIELELNGRPTTMDIAPGQNLLSALRASSCFSVKLGCETGDCGSCTVLLDDQPVNACMVTAARARGSRVTTMEGLLGNTLMKKLQEEFVHRGGIQCGYCTPGMLISLYAHFRDGGAADDHSLGHVLSGNLCRCTGYKKPIEAARAVAEGGGAS